MPKNHWDKSFSNKEFVYGEKENAFINEKSYLIKDHSYVGCFAEGEGRNAVYLAKLGHNVTAFDQSKVGLEKTKVLAEKNKVSVQTVQADLTKDKIEEQFDAAIMVFGHVPQENQTFFINNMIDSVKTNGYIIFEVYSKEQLIYNTGGPGSVEMLYDPVSMLNLIAPYKCLHFYYGEAERYEGKRHSGACHVIQVVIQK